MLNPTSNCWRIEQADRLAFLIDADDYFRVLRQAMLQAHHSIYILSWDINSQLRLRGNDDDSFPERLGDFLNALAKEKPDLNIYILNWDFAMIFAPAREFLPIYKMDWKTHHRVHFCLDDQHPEGASQHQKIVVIDDSLAFNGGLDLTLGRWDTSDHQADNPDRDRLDSKICNPYHDIQIMVSGAAAGALADLARSRWHNATGKKLAEMDSTPEPLWPEQVPIDIERARVGIARTQGAFKKLEEIREIQQHYCDAIATAERSIYIENQYLTAPAIENALRQSLEREEGPEIILVLPRETDGWLSQYTMDVLRIRLIRKLQETDHQQRLRVLYPDGPDLANKPINVHAKVMVVDDKIAVVGSANLNNRSMGLDSECNLIVEGDSAESKRGIASFRNRLMAEHMGSTEEKV
ncbi:MAG TPA: phospholipase D-like domain-containing protein, partial [Mariprofundaceae bacterium]|nr:phospholipase D-like domain-containing protein [Mariprofundaceae bacterium]